MKELKRKKYQKYPVREELNGHQILAYIDCPQCGHVMSLTTLHISPTSGKGGYPYEPRKCEHCNFTETYSLLNYDSYN